MENFLKTLGNITGGPVSTIVGLILFVSGGISIWKLDQSDLVWNSVEVGLFGVGCFLLLKSDEWIKSMLNKDKDKK